MAAVAPRRSSLYSLLLVRRSLSVSASLSSNSEKGGSDPIQKLFLEKLNEFNTKNQQGKVRVFALIEHYVYRKEERWRVFI